MSTILSNGVAKVDSDVLSQLKAKHPPRPSVVRLPSKEQIENDRANWQRESQAAVEDMVESKVDIDMPSEQPVDQGANEGMPVDSFPHLVINAEQILAAAKKAKRMTSGGLQQITPWLLKRAIIEDTTNDCAMVAGQVATRWGRGIFLLY